MEDSLEDIFSRWSGERPPIRREDIELFEKDYRGSIAEEDDVIDFFTRSAGSFVFTAASVDVTEIFLQVSWRCFCLARIHSLQQRRQRRAIHCSRSAVN